jgi:hypothetical protein
MHKRQGTSPTLSPGVTGDLSTLTISKRLPTLKTAPGHWEQGEVWGMLSYAASAFCTSMMVVTVKLAQEQGLSTWQLLMARSLFLAVVCGVQLKRSNDNFLGQRCADVLTHDCRAPARHRSAVLNTSFMCLGSTTTS